MAVTPLTNRPVPPNSDAHRAMFCWVTSTASQDPLDTDADQQALVNFCGTVGNNVLFLDIWLYLCGANWTAAKVTRMKQFLDLAHRSGIKVYALAGNVDWAQNQAWVMKNIIEPLMAYNAMCQQASQKFDGIVLDVEYWQDENLYPPAAHLPGLCDLIAAIRRRADCNLAVGVFAGWFLKDSTSTRPQITYKGKAAQDGEHLMDTADFVVIGSYRDTGAEQIVLAQPWFEYAEQVGLNLSLFVGAETINVQPANITYYGQGKAFMEQQFTGISAAFKVAQNAAYMGIAVHSYDGWKAMGA
jgi:hypothetical protein